MMSGSAQSEFLSVTKGMLQSSIFINDIVSSLNGDKLIFMLMTLLYYC